MKKVKIYLNEPIKANAGGPAGYLYNLKCGLQKVETGGLEIVFPHDDSGGEVGIQRIKSMIPKRMLDLLRVCKYVDFLNRSASVDRGLLEYDAIHFHSSIDAYMNRELLSEYTGKVILTTHTPCAPYKEIIDRLDPRDYARFKKRIDRLSEIDKYAYSRADHIIFPCKEAEEPYYNTWAEYATVRDQEKYRYMPTGIAKCTPKVSREEYRAQHGIPQGAFVVSYVGRHNEIKGYDILKEIGSSMLERDDDIRFLIAGKEEPLRGLQDDRWLEIGWTNDPHSLVAASDVFVLPNRETYFDLVLLEVISLGIPIVLSNTGGNRFFEQYKGSGMYFFSSLDEAVEQITLIKKKSTKQREADRRSLQNLYDSQFTVESFATRYVETLKGIL